METTLRFNVEGMVCSGCARTVRRVLEDLPGVTVEHLAVGEPVEVRLDEILCDRADIEEAVDQAGYRPVFDATTLQSEA